MCGKSPLVRRFEAVFSVVTFFSTLVYVVFVVVLIKNRTKDPFNAAFFRICLAIAATDLIQLFNMFLFDAQEYFPQSWKWGPGHFRYKWAVHISIWQCLNSQHLGMIVVAFNRFTAILTPLRHKKIWTRHLKTVLISMFVIPMLGMTIPAIATLEIKLFWELDENNVSFPCVLGAVYHPISMLAALFNLVAANVICSTIYTLLVIVIIVRRCKSSKMTVKVRAQINLTISGFCMFLTLFLLFLALLALQLRILSHPNQIVPYIYNAFLLVVSNSYSFINPYLVLMCSAATRDATKALLVGAGKWVRNLGKQSS